MHDDEIAAKTLFRIAHRIEPLFQFPSAQMRIGNDAIEIFHHDFLGEERKVSDRNIRQLLLPYTVAFIVVPVKRRMLPYMAQ